MYLVLWMIYLVAGYEADGRDHDKTVQRYCRDVGRLI